MTKETFWNVIDEVNKEVDVNDQDAVLKATEQKLMEFTPQEIVQWKTIQQHYNDLADTPGLYAAACVMNEYVTDNGFIDFRAWLISHGKEIYMKALKKPDSLADVDVKRGEAYFESHTYVSSYAFSKKSMLENEGAKNIYNIMKKALTDGGIEHVESLVRNTDFRERKDIREMQNPLDKGLYAYIKGLEDSYDIWNEARKHPLSEKQKIEIEAEIEFAPEVKFDKKKLHEIVPDLYRKMQIIQRYEKNFGNNDSDSMDIV